MKYKMLLLAVSLTLMINLAQSTELVYTPINPSFGGSALNGSYLLNKANAQNDNTAKKTDKDFVTRFKESLERSVLSEVARGVAGGDIKEGTYDTGDYRIEVIPAGGGLMVTVINLITDEVTVIEMPSYGVN
ncbi:curli production assembly protein CsgF [Shewanella sp. VB17]|uniref:curli assembly protein CsgF n=1 Tax=Shewanella sp. VB17 TaxID=2739432 RepID=UPI001564C578|nr:curli assembly protein CsgF [Shewanella sp. VB17]NRD72412.1 curli production assembly protein CsgF [Shewanella sp. VB17]